MKNANYKYFVDVKEVWNNRIIVESEKPLTEEELLEMVKQDVDEGILDYDYTLESDSWETGEL